jgi:hypothetical protein
MSQPMHKVQGWGADLDPANRPAYPKEAPSHVTTARGEVGVRQVPRVKIHKSTEHPDLTPVFGTTCPPTGLSGRIRDLAYQYSEGRQKHWLLLMLADRVNVVEGLIEDLTHGKVPNWGRERGWKSRVKHTNPERKRQRPLMIAAAGVGLLAAAVWIARESREG